MMCRCTVSACILHFLFLNLLDFTLFSFSTSLSVILGTNNNWLNPRFKKKRKKQYSKYKTLSATRCNTNVNDKYNYNNKMNMRSYLLDKSIIIVLITYYFS